MSADEQRLVVETWNDTFQAYPDTATAPGRFEEQAAKTPHGVAVRFEGEMLSYQELMDCSARLACCLQPRDDDGNEATDYLKLSAARLM
jgi:non-ribosomal peptide synthetase component F